EDHRGFRRRLEGAAAPPRLPPRQRGRAGLHVPRLGAAMLDDATFFLPVRELGRRLRARQLRSVELTEACLSRLETLGPKYNPVVTRMHQMALADAQRADRELAAGKPRGPLHGIPYGVKDLLATRGVPTTWGAAPYKNQMFDEDATVVTKLRE